MRVIAPSTAHPLHHSESHLCMKFTNGFFFRFLGAFNLEKLVRRTIALTTAVGHWATTNSVSLLYCPFQISLILSYFLTHMNTLKNK